MPYDTSQMEEALKARSKMPIIAWEDPFLIDIHALILGRAQTALQAFK